MSLVCLSSENCLRDFLCIIFSRGFLLGRQPCRSIWFSVRHMIWALTGWPLTPSTYAAMLAVLLCLFPKHNLWIWRWAHALNFFGTGTCPVKPLYGIDHPVAAQFQGLGNLLIAYAIFMLNNNSFFQILRELFAMRCHVELPVTSMREWEDNTKFNTPAPHSHLRPCITNESHDTGEYKLLIGLNLDIFTKLRVYSLLWPAVWT